MTATDRFIADLRALVDQAADEHATGARMALISSIDPTTLRLLLDVVEKARPFGDCCQTAKVCNSEDECVQALSTSYIALEAHLAKRGQP